MKGSVFLVILLLLGCQSKQMSSFISEGYRIEGNTGNKLIYEGHLKFYDTSTNNLLIECDYHNGKKNGEYKQYYKNRALQIDIFYIDNNENGIAKYFDESGNIIAKDYYYFGLRSGNAIRYRNTKLKSYSFYSLDNRKIFSFEYDLLKGKHLPDIMSDFFYYTTHEVMEENSDTPIYKTEYFLYTPNPPLEEFTYSLVEVDKSLKILSTLLKFDKNKAWSKFSYDAKLNAPNTSVAIELEISDSINNIDIGSLRVLK
jgi:hypothetical protein